MAGEKGSLTAKRVLPHVQRQVDKNMAATDDACLSLATSGTQTKDEDVDVNLSEVYFLIMHFLSSGPCSRATGQLWNELLQHKLLPRRYHAWYSRSGLPSGDEDDDGISFPLSYIQVLERNPDIEKDHLVKLLKHQLIASRRTEAPVEPSNSRIPTAADVPTILGQGPFSLLNTEPIKVQRLQLLSELRWPHWLSSQVRGLALREIGGGFSKHHRPPSVRAASYAILKPSVLVDKIQIIKKFRGHRNAVYCAIFDRTGQHIITGSDDRLVKIWSTETGFCLRSCRGHEGDITELSVSHGNSLVASASNDCTIRVWRLPDGVPVSVLRGHTAAVTAIAFRPRQSCEHHLLSSSDDGTCRIWDARDSSVKSRVYMPNPELISLSAKSIPSTQPVQQQPGLQISCCAFNADGSIFVTGSSDKFARVWDARKWNDEITGKPNYEMDVLKGHENAVNYVQFCGCAGPVKPNVFESTKEDGATKFKNVWPTRDSIVTCSRDGSAIIWICKPRKKTARYSHWSKAYHLRVPPPPMPPHPPRGGGPRQRFLPTPRGVNMIVWSLDNRFVLAAIMDCRICVWNAVDGSLVHSLTGHTKSTFVVDVHPFNPRIAMSAGYDGRVIIWDIWEGQPVRVYETGDFQIVDGSFSPDGTSLVVSDEVGQFYLLTTGEGQSQKDAKFDQFFLGDFRPLVRDLQGNVLDQETQLPPHQRNIQDLLCDANMIPYQEPYQSMYQQRRLGALGIDWQPLRLNLAVGMDDLNYVAFRDHPLVLHPHIPGSSVETAEGGARRWVEQPIDVDEEMDWEQDLTRLTDDSGSDYSASEEILSLLEDDEEDEGTASSSEGLGQSDDEEDDKNSVEETWLRRSNRKRKAEGHPHDYGERKIRKAPSCPHRVDSINDLGIHKVKRQGQSELIKTSPRPASEQRMTRPKRAAAANALQLFTNNKQSNEDGEEDDASSSHQDTSLYSDEEAESDGLPLSSDKNGGKHACQVNETAEAVEVNGMEEVFQRTGKDVVEMNEGAELKEEQQEDFECLMRNFEASSPVAEDISPRFNEGDKEFCKYENHADSKVGPMAIVLEKVTTPGRQDLLEQEDPSRRPRRLVLKLRKNETDILLPVNKDELEDPTTAETVSPEVDHLDISKEQTKRRLRRLILKAPDSATHMQDNSDGLSDTGNNENCSGSQHSMPEYDEDMPPGDLRRPRKRLKEKNQSELDLVPKYFERSCKAVASEPNSPASFSGSYRRRTDVYSTSIEKTVGEVFPDAAEDLPNEDTDIESEGINWSGNSEHKQSRMDSFEREAGAAHGPQGMSSPESFAKFPSLAQHCLSNELPSEEEYGKPRTRSSLGSETNQVNLKPQVVHCRYMGLSYGEPMLVHEEQQGGVGKAVNSLRGAIACQARKNSKKVAHNHCNSAFLQVNGEGHYRSAVLENRFKSPDHSSCVRLVDREERKALRDGSSGAMQSIPGDTDEVELCLLGGHNDSESGHDDASWSQSENVIGETDFSLHKRRTLCEIESTDIPSLKPEEDSTSKKKVRQVQAVVMDGVRAMRSRGKRGKREAVKKEREIYDTGKKAKRPSARINRAPGVSNYDDADTEENTSHSVQNIELHDIRSKRRGVGQCPQAEASSVKEKELRVSSRHKKEVTRDQGRQVNTSMVIRDKVARTRKSLAWLLQSEVEETRYIPQYGDEVVYLRQGHAEYLDMYRLDEPGPWTIYGDDLCHTEICQVVGLEYVSLPYSGETCCKFTLEFVDCTSCLQGKTFWLSLPELTNFPDFIIEKNRYDSSIERKWTNRDRCKVWWRSQNGQGGRWWEGRVINVKPKSVDFPESPWERFAVQYKSDPTNPYRHSPWELFDSTDAKWEQPHIDLQTRDRLLLVLESAANEPEDAYGLRKLRLASCKSDFVNRLPLPLTLDVLMQRLEKDYYHSTQAFYFDVQLLASNAERFCGNLHPMTQGLQAFVRELHIEIFSESSS
ncbi:hypothetical protein GOP47_0018090 [Adiantum capillus-veneris]|uniref:Uncharacterized protein n=1 Tax=Adiantum capillus-veneris TaxID=13818 RepID=A0A9D4UH41_ADICA|nr:hypothetical protein GOP47_0018090 [Adiantum capillus-veneris]